mgnify:CR=1 FL=1
MSTENNNHGDDGAIGSMRIGRRWVLGLMASAAAAGLGAGRAFAQEETIKIGVVLPLAGAFAVSGQDLLNGAKLAVEEINAGGGIKSIGGRKLELLIGDAGQSPETTVAAARRILNEEPVAALGSWYSSLTLAGTQVAEQRRIPWVTGSASDAITERGFKYTFKISGGTRATLPVLVDVVNLFGSGQPRLALLSDNNAPMQAVKEGIRGLLDPASIVSDHTWTPPLPDATPVVNAVMRVQPNVIYLGATATNDQVQILKQLAAQGNTAPLLMGASSAANPSFIETVGARGMEGVIVVTPVAFPGKGSDDIVARYVAATGQAFMDCEALTGYADVLIIAAALESAGKAEAEAVREALAGMDIADHPVLSSALPGGSRIRFDENGLRDGTVVQVLQWQDGQPRVVLPPEGGATHELKTRI